MNKNNLISFLKQSATMWNVHTRPYHAGYLCFSVKLNATYSNKTDGIIDELCTALADQIINADAMIKILKEYVGE